MILKRVVDSIFFQSNKFTACKIKDGEEVVSSFKDLVKHKLQIARICNWLLIGSNKITFL